MSDDVSVIVSASVFKNIPILDDPSMWAQALFLVCLILILRRLRGDMNDHYKKMEKLLEKITESL